MTTIRVGDRELRFERLARRTSESVFELLLFVEAESGDVSVRSRELSVSERSDVTASLVESALSDWHSEHPDLRVERFVIRESDRCGVGRAVEDDGAEAGSEHAGTRRNAAGSAGGPGPYRTTQVGFGDVSVDRGEEVEFHLANPETTAYGTRTGTVRGVKTGTEGVHVLVVETENGTNRVREDWLVEPESGDESRDDPEEPDGEN